MAETRSLAATDLDMELFKAAVARKNPTYAKESIARARLAFQQERSSENQIGCPVVLTEENIYPDIPPFPFLTDFDGRELLEGVIMQDPNMQDGLIDEHMRLAPEPSREGDASDAEEAEEFKSVEKWFNQLEKPTMVDRVRYETAKRNHDIRKKRSESRKFLQEEEVENDGDRNLDNELFVRQDDRPGSSTEARPAIKNSNHMEASAQSQTKGKKPNRQNRISAEEKRRSMQVGLTTILGTSSKTGNGNKPGRKPRRARGKSGKDSGPNVLSTLRTSLVKEAHASASLPALEGFTAGDKRKAVAQLIASIPTADQEEAKDDGKLIRKAPTKFTNMVRSDKEGGWKMEGLNSSMYNYQLLGCAWMRDQENSPTAPYGGMLCDMMGFGKTFQAIVNIVDGFPTDPDDPVKTTLIVVPAHLVKHWWDQLVMHCDANLIDDDVVEYHAQAKLSTPNPVKGLMKYRTVLTTYDTIRRSYPTFTSPKGVTDEKTLTELWKNEYEGKLGPLHRIKFQRIVLDEAHMIKNHTSSVSIAVRGLTGKYKWALTGTPVLNYVEEFYPLFDFLRVPETGTYAQFVKRYCEDEQAQKRLSNLLRSFMYRRTHATRLFSLPIIKLPDIQETIVKVKFSEAEKTLYKRIADMFLQNINGLGRAPNPKVAQFRCFLTMILKLRMFCSHLLTVQDILRHLLSESLVRELTLDGQVGGRQNSTTSREIVHWITAVKKNYESLIQQRQAEEQDQPVDSHIFSDNPEVIEKFRQYMDRLHADEDWSERLDRSICVDCKLPSEKLVLTSCLHLYCEECYCVLYHQTETAEMEKSGTERPAIIRPICRGCKTPVDEATRCGYGEDMEPQRVFAPVEEDWKILLPRRRKSKRKSIAERDDDSDEKDWIGACGAKMPSAKLNEIRNTIKRWKSERQDVKVVIFTQFMSFTRILAAMCMEEGWHCRRYHPANRPLAYREDADCGAEQKSRRVPKNPDISIMIASLQSGGLGLDMTAANKCILVDLWWNEAVQHQAISRIFRHGQTRDVECIKLIVEDSIDDYLLKLQTAKTKEIANTMGDEVLKQRETIVDLLKMFGEVEDNDGRLTVRTTKRKPKGKRKATAVASDERDGENDG